MNRTIYGPGAKEPHVWCGEDDGNLTARHTPAKECDGCDYLYKTHPNLLDSDDPVIIAELQKFLDRAAKDIKKRRWTRRWEDAKDAFGRFVESFLGKE